jgi:DNA-binding NarL/FixJ family response regulator
VAVKLPKKLTPREIQCCNLLSEGLHHKQIGMELGIKERTVKARLGHVYTKLGIDAASDRLLSVRLAVAWNSEIFRIGLKELGYL